MSAERDAGLAAMQSGDIETAIQQLELARQQNPNDYQTSMYLGAAYGQAKRHTDAVTILTTAVQTEPSNAQARYNLGIAMEQGGWIEQAKQAYEQAITLQPDYAKAQEALGRTQAILAQSQQIIDPMNMPTTALASPGYAPQPTLENQTQQPVYAPPTQQGYAQPPQPAYGAAPPPSPYGTPPAPYQQQVAMYPAQSQYHEDSFSVKDALRDWKEVLFSPRTFWQRQGDSDGLAAPSAMILTYVGTLLLIAGLLSLIFIGLREPVALPFIAIGIVIYGLMGIAGIFIVNFVWSGIFHLVGKMFGNRGTYAGSFRAMTYSQAPTYAMLLAALVVIIPFSGPVVSSLVKEIQSSSSATRTARTPRSDNPFGTTVPGQPTFGNTGANPFGTSAPRPTGLEDAPAGFTVGIVVYYLLNIVGFFWGLVLLGMGIAHVQKISTGGAVGTVLLGYLLPTALMIFLLMMLFAGLATAVGVAS